MSLSLYALIALSRKVVSLEQIQEVLAPQLRNQAKPRFEFDESPFCGAKNFFVELPGWWVRFFKDLHK